MDITQWLQGTAEAAAQPKLPDPLAFPDFLHPKDKEAGQRSTKQLKRQDRCSRDSSILRPAEHTVLASKRQHDALSHDDSCDSSQYTSGHGPSAARDAELQEQGDSDPYRRKPRRKTRPDRYEPKLTRVEQTTQRRRRDKTTAKSKDARKRKKKRTTDRSAIADIVHNFHANNVPAERLTLRSRPANMAIFKRGKASSPFRGRGLSDLVFSEMSFLQKRKQPALELEAADAPEGRAKRKRHTIREGEEISTYFHPKRPPLLERHANAQRACASNHRVSLIHSDGPRRYGPERRTSEETSIRPTVEVGPPEQHIRHAQSKVHPSPSNTYFTWSESNRPSIRPAIEIQDSGCLADELGVPSVGKSGVNSNSVTWATDSKKVGRSPLNHGKEALSERNEHMSRKQKEVLGHDKVRLRECPTQSGELKEPGRKGEHSTCIRPSEVTKTISVRKDEELTKSSEDYAALEALSELPPHPLPGREAERRDTEMLNEEPATSSSLAKLLLACEDVANVPVEVPRPPSRRRPQRDARRVPSRQMHVHFEPQRWMPYREEQPWLLQHPELDVFEHFVDHRPAQQLLENEQCEAQMSYDGENMLHYSPSLEEETEVAEDEFFGDDEQAYGYTNQFGASSPQPSYRRSRSIGRREINRAEEGQFVGFWRPNMLY